MGTYSANAVLPDSRTLLLSLELANWIASSEVFNDVQGISPSTQTWRLVVLLGKRASLAGLSHRVNHQELLENRVGIWRFGGHVSLFGISDFMGRDLKGWRRDGQTRLRSETSSMSRPTGLGREA